MDGPPSSTSTSSRIQEAIAKLSAEFDRQLPGRLGRARELLQAPDLGADLPELVRIMHTLAGTAATFGRAPLGVAAKALEEHLNHAGPAPQPADWDEARRLFDLVESTAAGR